MPEAADPSSGDVGDGGAATRNAQREQGVVFNTLALLVSLLYDAAVGGDIPHERRPFSL
jgi:hypothetical protein